MTSEAGAGEGRLAGWALVALQLVLLGVIFFWPSTNPVTLPLRVGFGAVAVLGAAWIAWGALALGRRLTPHPAPVPSATLRTDGPYRFVRHPIYSGVMALSLGAAGSSGSALKWAAFLLLVAVLAVKARYEERLLRGTFPEYGQYALRTPRFVPSLRRHRPRS